MTACGNAGKPACVSDAPPASRVLCEHHHWPLRGARKTRRHAWVRLLGEHPTAAQGFSTARLRAFRCEVLRPGLQAGYTGRDGKTPCKSRPPAPPHGTPRPVPPAGAPAPRLHIPYIPQNRFRHRVFTHFLGRRLTAPSAVANIDTSVPLKNPVFVTVGAELPTETA